MHTVKVSFETAYCYQIAKSARKVYEKLSYILKINTLWNKIKHGVLQNYYPNNDFKKRKKSVLI